MSSGTSEIWECRSSEPARGVQRIRHLIVNSYIIWEPGISNWFLVDGGMFSFSLRKILRKAAERFGPNTPPQAVIMTHGHFDHIGALKPLLRKWDVPVYAHELEAPFLTGRADYLPPDPTVGGGMMAWLAFLYPRRGLDLSGHVQALPADGSIPGLPSWRWIHTPGHTEGHVALFRERDRVLIPGDAFVTQKQESFFAVLTQKKELHGPPSYFTPDWAAARRSVQKLAELNPAVVSSGHGKPFAGPELQFQLNRLAERFNELAVPKRGRYVNRSDSVALAPALAAR